MKIVNNISLVTKIIVVVSVFFAILLGYFSFVVLNTYEKILYKEQVNKIEILFNTLNPIVKVNLEFDFLDNIDKEFRKVASSNKDVRKIILYNSKRKILVKVVKKTKVDNIISLEKEIKIDNETSYLKISYSNNSYKEAIKEFKKVLIIIIFLSFILIIFLIRLLKYIFKPFSDIVVRLKNVKPENFENFQCQKIDGNNEVAIINNVIKDMLDRIIFYTTNLENKVKEEIEKNREKEELIIHQNRLAQLGEMLSMIAHQWRQPLNSISSLVSALELKILLNQYDKDYFSKQLKNISNYIQYLSSTIDDFRNFFRKETNKEESSLEEIIEDSLNIIGSLIESLNINLIKEYKANVKFLTYKSELGQVVLNILKNSVDVLKERNVKNPFIKIYTKLSKNGIILEIVDNGGGIDKDIINKIFDPYFTTKKKDGTGLGLYMSKKIIEQRCQGSLEVENFEDGVKFIIILKRKVNNG